ncbi:hypothetical protein ABIE85_005778 [Bradyrhizobium diazoefficiens]|jgi:hypothetical protein
MIRAIDAKRFLTQVANDNEPDIRRNRPRRRKIALAA